MNSLEKEYADRDAWGMVASVNVYECDKDLIKDPKSIQQLIIDLCDKINMKRYGDSMIQRFADGALEGYSAFQFIETSSVTMHFDETKNRAFIDIFSCKFFDHVDAETFCREYLKGSRSSVTYYLRD